MSGSLRATGWLDPRAARLASILVWLAPLALGLALSWHTLTDLDVWLHDRVGRDVLAGQGVPHRNAFSFTAPDHPWTDHEWLFQVVLAAPGLGRTPAARAAIWGTAQSLLVLWLLLLFWREAAGKAPDGRPSSLRRAAALSLAAVASLALLWPRIEPRPELVSMALLLLAVRGIERALAAPPPATPPAGAARWRALVDPRSPAGRTFWLAVLWAQLHGFWLLVPVLWIIAALLPLPSGGATPAPFATPLRRAGPAVATFLAGGLTPNGLAGLIYPLRALGQLGGAVDLRGTIAELTPLLSAANQLALTVLAFKLCLVWAVLWTLATAGRVSPLRVILLAAGLAAAAYGQRNLGVCAVAFFLAHSGYDGARPLLWRRRPRRGGSSGAWGIRIARAGPLVGLGLGIAVAALWLPDILSDRFYLREGAARRAGLGLTPALYPFRIADGLAAGGSGAANRIANDIDAASTLVGARAGRVFIDGRTEAYPPEVWRDYLILRNGGDRALGVLARRGADAVAIANANPAVQGLLETLLASPRWRLADADDAGILFLPGPAGGASPGDVPPGEVPPGGVPPDGEAVPAAPAGGPRPENAEKLRAAQRRLLAELPAAGGGTRVADRCAALASLLKRGGLPAEAEALELRGLAARPDHPLLNHNHGNSQMARGDWQGAAASFRAALAMNGRLVDARLNLGVCLFQAGDVARAADAFARAVRHDPRRIEAWADLGEARLRLGDRPGALAAYRRALALRPGDPRLRQRIDAIGRGAQ